MLTARRRLIVSLAAISSFAHSRYLGPSLSMSQAIAHAEGQVSCERFLTYDYKPIGNTLKLKDETQFYGVGNTRGKQGVILIPDTWGWNAGRVRNIADFLSSNDMYCVVPQLMGSSSEGGDSLSVTESSSFGEYMKSQTFDGHLKPKVSSLVKFLQGEGVEKIIIIGFSWGAWVALNVLASDLAQSFVGGVLAHPSINLEERIYGGSLVDLFSRVERPLLMLPAKGDPDEYFPLVKLHKFKCPSTDYFDYHGVEHGFLLRGSVDNIDIKNANTKALGQILNFCRGHFQMNERDLVNEVAKSDFSDTGEFSGPRRMPSWTSWIGSLGQSSKESAQRATNIVKDNLSRTGEVVNDQVGRTGDSLRDSANYLKESAAQGVQKSRETVSQTGQYVGDATQQGYERVKGATSQTGQYAVDTARSGYDAAKRTGDYIGETTHEGYQHAKETGQAAGERGREAGVSLGEYTKKAGDVIWEGAHRLGESIKQTFSGDSNQTSENSGANKGQDDRTQSIRGTTGQTEGTGDWVGRKASETGQYTKESAQSGYDKAKETANWTGENLNQGKDYAKDQADKTGQAASETASKGYEGAAQSVEWGKEKAGEAGDYVRGKMTEGYEAGKDTMGKVGESIQRTRDSAQDTANKGNEQVHKTSEWMGEKASEGKDQVGKAESAIGENIKKAGEGVQEHSKGSTKADKGKPTNK